MPDLETLLRDVRPCLVRVPGQQQAVGHREPGVVRGERVVVSAQIVQSGQSRLRTAQRSGNIGWKSVVRR